MVFPGWVLARSIPYDCLIGLATGKYQLYGGVIRWAPGTPNAGQIVRHLIPIGLTPMSAIPGLDLVPGIVANLQLHELKGMTQANTYELMKIAGQVTSLTQATNQVLQVATGTAFLSGLGLTVSTIGFIAINKKLNAIDDRLKEIQKDVQAIRSFLESTERAKLCAALSALLKIDETTASEHRHTILHNARHTFAEINMRYRELLTEANTVETAMANEEYFTLTGLALVRCSAELGLLNVAYKEMEELNTLWQSQSRRIAKEVLVGEYPERFLATDFVEAVSISELVQWLDFTYEEQKGLSWIDEFRLKINESWYFKGWFSGHGFGLNKNVGIGLEKEQALVIPTLRNLIARSAVLEGFVSQYELFESEQMKPSEFGRRVAALPESSAVDGYFILEPLKKEPVKQAG